MRAITRVRMKERKKAEADVEKAKKEKELFNYFALQMPRPHSLTTLERKKSG